MNGCRYRNINKGAILAAIACLAVFVFTCPAHAQSIQQSDTVQTEMLELNTTPETQSPDQNRSADIPQESSGEKNWRLETTGSFTNVTDDYGNWYGGGTRLTYLGNKVFTPTVSVATQTRPEGDQQTYGLSSYINFGKYAYAHIGASTAPNRGTILFPSFRYDATGFVKIPKINGLVLTVGHTNYRLGGNKSRSISVGGIYYFGKVILDGNIAFHRSDPGALTSKSGHLSFMAGKQGSYWIGAGAHGGDLNYQLLGTVPYDVHFTGYGVSAFFQKWIRKNWGLTERYYFTNLLSAYKSNSASITFFYEF